jgi:hypothetical protein
MRRFLPILSCAISFSLKAQTASDSLTPAQVRADLDFVAHTVTDMHPFPWHSVQAESFRLLQDSLAVSIKGPIAAEDSWPLVSRLCAAIREGHTSADFPASFANALQAGRFGLFPFSISDIDPAGFTVRGDLSDDTSLRSGDRIVAINGCRSDDLYAQLTSFFGGLPAWRKVKAMQDTLSLIHLASIRSPYTIRYVQDGIEKEKTVMSVLLTTLRQRGGTAQALPGSPEAGALYVRAPSRRHRPAAFQQHEHGL